MTVAVLTYNAPHRKTQDLLYQLKLKTEETVYIIGMPYSYKKTHIPLIQHRPSKCINVSNHTLCKKLGYNYMEIQSNFLLDTLENLNPDIILIGGMGILDKKIVEKFLVVNCHPGILPDIRGLDALKWAIYLGKEIGVTLHILDEVVDGGYRIKELLIPIEKGDTFHSIAYRQYEYEIDLLSDSVQLLKNIKGKDELCKIDISNTVAFKRMDLDKEKILHSILKNRLEKI